VVPTGEHAPHALRGPKIHAAARLEQAAQYCSSRDADLQRVKRIADEPDVAKEPGPGDEQDQSQTDPHLPPPPIGPPECIRQEQEQGNREQRRVLGRKAQAERHSNSPWSEGLAQSRGRGSGDGGNEKRGHEQIVFS